MKRIAVFVIGCMIAAMAGVHGAQAKSLGDLKIVYPADVNKVCGASAGFDEIRGCYVQRVDQGKAPTYTIYLNSTLPPQVRDYVFLYSVGQFLTYETTDQQLRAVFHPSPEKLSLVGNNMHAYVSEQFVTWFYEEAADWDKGLDTDDGAPVDEFFRNALVGIR